MLVLNIRNDGSGDEATGNYDYNVMINYNIVANGRIEGHQRNYGWKALIIELAKNLAREMVEENNTKITGDTQEPHNSQ